MEYSTKGDDNQKTRTSIVKESLKAQFNHNRVISISSVRQEHLDFFETGCITFFIYGVQVDKMENAKLMKMTTKVRNTLSHFHNPAKWIFILY